MNNKKWSLPVLLIPGLIFFLLVKAFIVNAPVYDDVEAFNDFILKLIESGNPASALPLFFDNSSDHIVFFGRIVCALYFWVTSRINFSDLILIGNLSHIGLFWVMYKKSLLSRENTIFFLPVSLLLFNIQNWYYSSFWAITVYQFPVVLFLVCLTLYFLSASGKYTFPLAVILGGIVTFSHGNGFSVWLCGVFMLWALGWRKKLLFWSFSGVLFTGIFFQKMLSNQGNQLSSFSDAGRVLVGFFSYVGTYFDVLPVTDISLTLRALFPVLFGVVSLIVIVFACIEILFIRKMEVLRKPSSVFWISCMLFIFFSAVIIGLFRSVDNPFRFLTVSPHYRAGSGVFVACMYLWVMSIVPDKFKKRVFLFSLVIIGIPYVFSYIYIMQVVRDFYHSNQANVYNQKNNRAGFMGPLNTPQGAYADSIMTKSVSEKIYSYPENPVFKEMDDYLEKNKAEISQDLDITEGDAYFMFQGKPGEVRMSREDGLFLVLQSDKNRWVFPFKKTNTAVIGSNLRLRNTFSVVVDKAFLAGGVYEVILVSRFRGKTKFSRSEKPVSV